MDALGYQACKRQAMGYVLESYQRLLQGQPEGAVSEDGQVISGQFRPNLNPLCHLWRWRITRRLGYTA